MACRPSVSLFALAPESYSVTLQSELPDNITLSWDADIIADTIKPYVLENRITTVCIS